ncbi:MAG: precorrin-3B synthase, partial [Zavarzinia sp.]|nr:precorrin-3B synthase [Zavarzinia sp.]
VPLSRLTPAQAIGIALAAEARGNGEIDLSARANLQLRGVTPERHGALLADLAALGLLDRDVATESRRNLVITPLWSDMVETGALAGAILAGLADAPPLPGKFGAVLDHGPAPVLTDVPGDVRIERDVAGRLLLRADGAPTGCAVTPDEIRLRVAALARWFVEAGGVNDGRGRMKALLTSGIPLPVPLVGDSRPAPAAPPPGPGVHARGAIVAFAFGRLRAEMLHAIATRGRALRLTPWRALLIEGGALPDLPGLITDASDPRLRVFACTGAPACPQGAAPVRDLALALAPRVPADRVLHVSACAKGCAHPAPADVTLTARADGFALIRNGVAGDTPLRTALAPETLIDNLTLPFERP